MQCQILPQNKSNKTNPFSSIANTVNPSIQNW
jgi:hypothetical protein